jgi:hypothetical protein
VNRSRDLHLLVGAVGLSALGDWLALVPLALHLGETTESGILVALLFVAVWSPAIVLAGRRDCSPTVSTGAACSSSSRWRRSGSLARSRS